MPNGTYGGVRGKETKVGQKTFVSRPTRLYTANGNRSAERLTEQRKSPTCVGLFVYMGRIILLWGVGCCLL